MFDDILLTVGGPPGSGTSTVCRMLEVELGLEYIYAGQVFRDKANEMGLSLSEFSRLCEEEPEYDKGLDKEMVSRARKGRAILEGRMIGPLCKKENIPSFKIYIFADKEVRANRVGERDGGEIQEVLRTMEDREESEAQRYLQYYDIDPREQHWYDLVIDSSFITPEEEIEIILKAMRSGETS